MIVEPFETFLWYWRTKLWYYTFQRGYSYSIIHTEQHNIHSLTQRHHNKILFFFSQISAKNPYDVITHSKFMTWQQKANLHKKSSNCDSCLSLARYGAFYTIAFQVWRYFIVLDVYVIYTLYNRSFHNILLVDWPNHVGCLKSSTNVLLYDEIKSNWFENIFYNEESL